MRQGHNKSSTLRIHSLKKIRVSWIFFYQTFQGLGLGKLIPARESLVSDIPAGDRKSLNLYYSVSKVKSHKDELKFESDGLLVLGYAVLVPSDRVLVPSNGVLVPADSVLVPVDNILVPADSVLVPVDNVLVPSNGVLVPSGRGPCP